MQILSLETCSMVTMAMWESLIEVMWDVTPNHHAKAIEAGRQDWNGQ